MYKVVRVLNNNVEMVIGTNMTESVAEDCFFDEKGIFLEYGGTNSKVPYGTKRIVMYKDGKVVDVATAF